MHLKISSARCRPFCCVLNVLTHWGRVTHICISKLTIIGSDYGLLPWRPQAIIWTNAGILLIGPLGANFSGNLIEILTFSYTKVRLKVSSAKCRPFCFVLNVLSGPVLLLHMCCQAQGQTPATKNTPRNYLFFVLLKCYSFIMTHKLQVWTKSGLDYFVMFVMMQHHRLGMQYRHYKHNRCIYKIYSILYLP